MRNTVLVPTKDSVYTKSISRIIDDHGGYEIVDEDEELPIPWDADFRIENKNLVLEGGAGPGGIGYSKTIIPLRKIGRGVSISIDLPRLTDDEADEFINNGWIVK